MGFFITLFFITYDDHRTGWWDHSHIDSVLMSVAVVSVVTVLGVVSPVILMAEYQGGSAQQERGAGRVLDRRAHRDRLRFCARADMRFDSDSQTFLFSI